MRKYVFAVLLMGAMTACGRDFRMDRGAEIPLWMEMCANRWL